MGLLPDSRRILASIQGNRANTARFGHLRKGNRLLKDMVTDVRQQD
jgi:hypothetical protein